MLLDASSDLGLTFWGMREYDGVRFYIEPETDLPEICPFKKPRKSTPCPHRGLCVDNYVKWQPRLFRVGNPDLVELFPKGLDISQEYTFINAGYMPPKVRLEKLLDITNAVPLVIYGLKSSHNYRKVFEMARSSYIRPVYIFGAGDIPVPEDFK